MLTIYQLHSPCFLPDLHFPAEAVTQLANKVGRTHHPFLCLNNSITDVSAYFHRRREALRERGSGHTGGVTRCRIPSSCHRSATHEPTRSSSCACATRKAASVILSPNAKTCGLQSQPCPDLTSGETSGLPATLSTIITGTINLKSKKRTPPPGATQRNA